MKQIDDITWQSNDGLITFKNMDCNEFMAGCKENEFDLNLSDPPYGFNNGNIPNNAAKQEIYKKYKEQIWDIKPDKFSFEEIFKQWSNNNKYYFLDLEARYVVKENKLTFFLSGNNLFNTETFRNYSISDINISQTEYRLMPRYVLLKMEYRF